MVNTIVTANQQHSNKDIGTFFLPLHISLYTVCPFYRVTHHDSCQPEVCHPRCVLKD